MPTVYRFCSCCRQPFLTYATGDTIPTCNDCWLKIVLGTTDDKKDAEAPLVS